MSRMHERLLAAVIMAAMVGCVASGDDLGGGAGDSASNGITRTLRLTTRDGQKAELSCEIAYAWVGADLSQAARDVLVSGLFVKAATELVPSRDAAALQKGVDGALLESMELHRHEYAPLARDAIMLESADCTVSIAP